MSKSNLSTTASSGRNAWMDGLKAIACLQVFFNHFMCTFYPAFYFEGEQVSHINGWDKWLLNSPLRIFFDGVMYLEIFCMLSGIFMCMKVMKMTNPREQMTKVVVGRYFRIVMPIIPIGLFVWVAGKLGLFTNVAASAITKSDWLGEFYNQAVSFGQMIFAVLIKIPFFGDDSISTAFWMLNQMMIGAFISMLLGMVYWKMKKRCVYVYIFVMLILIPRHDFLVVFALAAIIAWAIVEGYIDFLKKIDASGKVASIVGIICIIAGHVIGAYPVRTEPMGIYRYMNVGYSELIWMIGAFLVFFGLWNVPALQKALAISPLTLLGNISYDFYLLHIPLMFSLGTGAFLLLYGMGMEYNVICLCVLIFLTAVLAGCAFLYNKFELKYCKVIENAVMGFLNDRE